MKKFKKSFIVAFVAILAVVCMCVSLTACGGDKAKTLTATAYSEASEQDSSGWYAELGTVVTVNTGRLELYDDGTYELYTTLTNYADWGTVIIGTIYLTQNGSYTTTSSDEFGMIVSLNASENYTMHGLNFKTSEHVNLDSSKSTKEELDAGFGTIAGQQMSDLLIKAATSVEIDAKENTYKMN